MNEEKPDKDSAAQESNDKGGKTGTFIWELILFGGVATGLWVWGEHLDKNGYPVIGSCVNLLACLLFFAIIPVIAKKVWPSVGRVWLWFGVSATLFAIVWAYVTWSNRPPLAEWQPPKLPTECKQVFVELGAFCTCVYDVSEIKKRPNQTVAMTNYFGGDHAYNVDLRYPSVWHYTNPPPELLESFNLKNPLNFTNACIPLSFSVSLQKERLYVGFSVSSDAGDVKIEGNQPKNGIPSKWDWNHNSNAVEIVDEFGRPTCRVSYRNAYTVRLETYCITNGTYFILGDNRYGFVNSSTLQDQNSKYETNQLKPLFKYPSWQHPGEYAN